MESNIITKSERDSLLQVARLRARVAKDEVAAYGAKLKADFEKQMDTHYPWDSDETWREMAELMERTKREAKSQGCRAEQRTRDPGVGSTNLRLGLERARPEHLKKSARSSFADDSSPHEVPVYADRSGFLRAKKRAQESLRELLPAPTTYDGLILPGPAYEQFPSGWHGP
jgi:hypothetical protein